MAKSFHSIISSGDIEVMHKGEEVALKLPAWLIAADGKLEDEAQLLKWAQEQEVLLPALQSAIQKVIIEIRASARPADSEDKPISIISDIIAAQERVDNFVWKATPKPGQSKAVLATDALKKQKASMITAMKELGIDEDLISQAIAKLSQ